MARGLGREGWVCVNHLLTGWPVAGFPGAVLPCSVSQRPDGLQLELWAEGVRGCAEAEPEGAQPQHRKASIAPPSGKPSQNYSPSRNYCQRSRDPAPRPLGAKSVLRHRKHRGKRKASAEREEGDMGAVRMGRGPRDH